MNSTLLPPIPEKNLVVPGWLREDKAPSKRVRLPHPTIHRYCEANGREVFQRMRIRYNDGTKDVIYRYKARTHRELMNSKYGWIYKKHPDADSYLYRYPELFDAVSENVPEILWCEGESDADAAARAGAIATSHHQAAGNASAEQAERFYGYEGLVLIALDRDLPGAYCAHKRHALLVATGLAPEQLVFVAPRIGKDVRDHLEGGYRLAELKRVSLASVAKAAAKWTPAASRRAGYWPYKPLEPTYEDGTPACL